MEPEKELVHNIHKKPRLFSDSQKNNYKLYSIQYPVYTFYTLYMQNPRQIFKQTTGKLTQIRRNCLLLSWT